MTEQTITAFYDNRQDAADAIEKLISAGITRANVKILPETATATTATTTTARTTADDDGFWGSLRDFFLPDEDRHFYAEGLRRGGTMVTVRVEAAQADRAMSILEEHGSVDLDERETTWRKEGWKDYSTAAAAGTLPSYATASSTRATGGAMAASATDRSYAGAKNETDQVIPIVEERIDIAKRQVSGGRVRVRSYVVETPVSEQVTLRDERVHIERVPTPERPLTAADDALFKDRTIELNERTEEAVVSKQAFVKEELRLSKDATQRTETVTDTVRRTEVEVEDDRNKGLTTKETIERTGTTGTDRR